MNINVTIEIGERSGRWGSIENQGSASVAFDWPENVPIPSLGQIVEGLAVEAQRLHMVEKAKAEAE